jgi:enoyl-CoA hydratase/carnithine racemase
MDAARANAFANLPASLKAGMNGEIAVLRLARPQKRNALNDETVLGIERFFLNLPEAARAVVIHGEGEHFSAGLDLSELTERNVAEGVEHSRMWHRVFERIEFGRVPVVAVLHGAVVGGGLELACACHIRVAEASAYYALPEGRRGIFVGGGGSVRIPRLIGVARMQDMMLTGRTYNADEGLQIGIAQYLVKDGEGMAKGMEIAQKICENAPMTNFAVIHALPRIAGGDEASGYMTESLVASIAQNEPEAKARLKAFLEKRAPKAVRD